MIRLWDLSKELLVHDIKTGLDLAVTSLTHDKSANGNIIVAGFTDGSIRLYDKRTPQDSHV